MNGGGPGSSRRYAAASAIVLAGLVLAALALPAPAATGVDPPAFVQQVSKRGLTANLTLAPTANVSTGNRLIVEAGVWSAGNASASSVTDTAGNTYTKLTSFKA